MLRLQVLVTMLAAGVAVTPVAAQEPKASTQPKDVPLELSIINKAGDWELDTRGDRPTQFQEKILQAQKLGSLLPATRCDLELQIKNTGKSPIRIWVDGDAALLTLDLQGSGAVTVDVKSPLGGYIPPRAVSIEPGKAYRIPLTSLMHGLRMKSKYSYVTENGGYQLTATLKTGVAPAPSGSRGLSLGFGEVILKSAPIEFYVKRPS